MPTLIQPAHLGLSRPPDLSLRFLLREIPIAVAGVVFLMLLFIYWNPALQSAAAPDKAFSANQNAGFSKGETIARAPLVSSPFRHNQSLADRVIAMTRLEQMQSSALPILLASLSDPDPTIRVASIQVLGWIKSREAALALERATFDPLPDVREAAIRALGELELLQALPRLQELQVVQSNFYVQEAAYLAEQKLNAQVAAELGLGPSQIQALSVASSTGWAFAMTSNRLYAKRDGDWHPVENLPGLPTGVVVADSSGESVYAGTVAGLFKSTDGGNSWQPISIQLPLVPSVRATAVALGPSDSQKVYIALVATSSSNSVLMTSLGVYSSSDGGTSWSFLQDSPRDYVTTRLVLDRSLPGYLFGATGIGTWRYTLDSHFTGSHPN